MTEIEQLRKEVNELRERIALLESNHRLRPTNVPVQTQPMLTPPYVITCGGTK